MKHSEHQHHNMKVHSGHDKHEGHSPEMFKQKFWLSLLLTIPTVLFSHMIQDWFDYSLPMFYGSEYIPFLFGTILFIYGGWVFIKGAWLELKDHRPGMMTLIAQAIIIAYIYSTLTTFVWAGSDFFWELATLITIMIFGHWMEMRSVMAAQGALDQLAKLLPDEAELASGERVPLTQLKLKDILLVRPGAKIPADGLVVKGHSSVNESMITGESKSVEKTLGQEVIAGTVNGNGSLQIEVSRIGESTVLAGIMRLVAEAQASKSKAQILADKAAFYLTIIAMISGGVTLMFWLNQDVGVVFALERVVTVLIIACPHALGLAIPLVTSISTTLAANKGLLVRDRLALESARNIDIVLFDKTGTLTLGQQGITDVIAVTGKEQETILRLAASAEQESEHSLARAIVNKALEQNLKLLPVANFQALPGRGVSALVDSEKILIGGPQLLAELEVKIPSILLPKVAELEGEGKAVLSVLKNGAVIGLLILSDVIKPESAQAVRQLQAMGKQVAMLTGDSVSVAQYVAKELGIKRYFAEVLPGDKSSKVKELQDQGLKVAMVGDGVNDAPALTQAEVGIAIGAGTDVAIESAGIILAKNDPRDIAKIITLSKASYRKMLQNLFWATGYNVLAIPLAAGVFGIILAPAYGAILMSISTIVVAINAQFLRRLKL